MDESPSWRIRGLPMDAVRVFGVPDETSGQTLEVEPARDGYGDGAFVVLSAKKTS